MVTRNWYNVYKSQRATKPIANALTGLTGVTYSSGYSTNVPNDLLMFRAFSVVYDVNSRGIVLGSGTTPATIDDYMLENMITSGLSASVATTLDAGNDMCLTLTITNTSAEDITIGEIGMVFSAPTGNNSGSKMVLIERTVLDAPVTIPAGGIGKVEYSIRMNYPTA